MNVHRDRSECLILSTPHKAAIELTIGITGAFNLDPKEANAFTTKQTTLVCVINKRVISPSRIVLLSVFLFSSYTCTHTHTTHEAERKNTESFGSSLVYYCCISHEMLSVHMSGMSGVRNTE